MHCAACQPNCSRGVRADLEVADVDGIEADEGRVQPDVGLGQAVADQVVLAAVEDLLETVERLEELGARLLVRLLLDREARLRRVSSGPLVARAPCTRHC